MNFTSDKVRRFRTVLTNGVDKVEITGNRNGCFIDLPNGMMYSILNGEVYINGLRAWTQVEEITE